MPVLLGRPQIAYNRCHLRGKDRHGAAAWAACLFRQRSTQAHAICTAGFSHIWRKPLIADPTHDQPETITKVCKRVLHSSFHSFGRAGFSSEIHVLQHCLAKGAPSTSIHHNIVCPEGSYICALALCKESPAIASPA